MDDKNTILEPFSGLNVLNPFKGLGLIERDIAYDLIWYNRNDSEADELYTKMREYCHTHLLRHTKVPEPQSYYEKTLREYRIPSFSRRVNLFMDDEGLLYYDVGYNDDYGPQERYINEGPIKTSIPKSYNPDPYRPEKLDFDIAKIGGNVGWFFGGVGYLSFAEVLKTSQFSTQMLVDYMSKAKDNTGWFTAFVDGEIRKLEINFTATEPIETDDYNATIVTFAGDYQIFSRISPYSENGKNWVRKIDCERVLIPGVYGKTETQLKLCYLEITVPSFRSEGRTDSYYNGDYRVNPSEYMTDESEIKILRTKIHKTDHVINCGLLYYTNSIPKTEFLGYRTIPIYVNRKGENDMSYSPRLRPLNLKAHLMNQFALNQLNTEMWSTNFFKKWLDHFAVDGASIANRFMVSTKEAGKNITSCKWFFGLSPKSFGEGGLVRMSETGAIRLGMLNVPLRVPFYDVDDETATLVETTFSMNNIEKESLEYGNTTYDIFLPYFGYVTLDDVHENDRLTIVLRANIVTGLGTWIITTDSRFITSVECQVGIDVPIQAVKSENLVDNSLNALGRSPLTKTILGGVVGGTINAGASLEAGNTSGYGASLTSTSGPDGFLNGMNEIFITVKRPELYDISGFSGYDVNDKGIVGEFKKYVKARDVNKESFGGIPAWAVEEIELKLKAGVYINP